MKLKSLAFAISSVAVVSAAHAGTVFSENFESGLAAWQGKEGGAHNAAVVADPLGGGSNVLKFNALNGAGDIFTLSTFSSIDNNFTLSFDYLGTCGNGNCGGFVGYSYGLPGGHIWLGGTGSGYPDLLPDTNRWEHVSISFSANPGIHLMLEQFSSSSGAPGTAYFDNITLSVTPVPEPETYAMMLAGLGLLGAVARRRKHR